MAPDEYQICKRKMLENIGEKNYVYLRMFVVISEELAQINY